MKEKIKAGDVVSYSSVIGGPVTSTGHVVECVLHQPNNFGTDEAWIKGKSGCGIKEGMKTKTMKSDGDVTLNSCRKEIKRLRKAINDCIAQNGHLADGDDCTLKGLKDALKSSSRY